MTQDPGFKTAVSVLMNQTNEALIEGALLPCLNQSELTDWIEPQYEESIRYFNYFEGLTNRQIGQRSGTQTETLNATQMPSHTHTGAVNVGTNP